MFFEVKNVSTKGLLMNILECNLKDDAKSWVLTGEEYVKADVKNDVKNTGFNCQEQDFFAK